MTVPRRARTAPSASVEPALTEAAPAAEPAPAGLGYERWMGFLSNVIAPASLITGLLFYFGYVSSRAFFLYFGIDVDVLSLSNQQFVMRSPGAIFIPVMVLILLAAGIMVAHRLLRRRVVAADTGRQSRTIGVFVWTGVVLIVIGLVLAFSYAALAAWPYYGFTTALALALGSALAAYGASTWRVVTGAKQGRALVVLLVAAMVAGTFWATASVAEWWGRGQARVQAGDLSTLPAVVLDTKERLATGNPAIVATTLDRDLDEEGKPVAGQFAYRYHGLRLLVRGGDFVFLVPDEWSKDASTLVIPIDPDAYRVRFRFFPDDVPPD